MFGLCFVFFFQAEDGIRYLVRSRGLGDVYKRQVGYQTAIAASGRTGAMLLLALSFSMVIVLIAALDLSLIHI